MASRSLAELETRTHALVADFLAQCNLRGYHVIVTCTYRSPEEQDGLYAQGRTAPGRIVTNARGGESFHNVRRAIDIVAIVNGKPSWEDEDVWKQLGTLGETCGLEWGGNWPTFKDRPHLQNAVCGLHGIPHKAREFSPKDGSCTKAA